MEDRRISRALRAIRRQLAWRQVDLADRARVAQSTVSLLEPGRIDGLSVRALRHICSAMDADLVLVIRWRGGDLDRILDERHARLGAQFVRRLEELGWTVFPEMTFSIYGERGSIDLLAWHSETRTLLVVELKSELTSVEETLRRLDVKDRLAARFAAERFGWRARNVARILVLPDDRTSRRRVEAHRGLLERAFPTPPSEVRRWLHHPSGSIAGVLFVSDSDHTRGRHGMSARKRIRKPVTGADRA
jgi:transcriptional regulator with XRE-family HTH domain